MNPLFPLHAALLPESSDSAPNNLTSGCICHLCSHVLKIKTSECSRSWCSAVLDAINNYQTWRHTNTILGQSNWLYASPGDWVALGYIMCGCQGFRYSVILSLWLNKTRLMMIQNKFNNKPKWLNNDYSGHTFYVGRMCNGMTLHCCWGVLCDPSFVPCNYWKSHSNSSVTSID